MDFQTIGLSDGIVAALAKQNITQPTQSQELATPLIIQGRDVILQSKTGSGKTLAYLLPLYQRQGETVEKGAQAIILVPTKELAMQIHQEVQILSQNSGIPLKSAVLFGNVNINTQIERLKGKPQIIIGTCDRVLALIQKKKIAAHLVKTFIVDEADKLLDKQSIEMLKAVRKTCMRDTQTVFVSATFLPQNIAEAMKLAPEGQLVQTQTQAEIPATITHQYMICDRRDKLENLRKFIRILNPEKSIIFINDLSEINLAVEKLKYHGLDCACIHSESTKEERRTRLTAFKEGKLRHLVATDLAARGLHVDEIPCIFHVNIAEEPTDYLHRAGRTGRNGAAGLSICLTTEGELQWLAKYRSKFKIQFEEVAPKEDKIIYIKHK